MPDKRISFVPNRIACLHFLVILAFILPACNDLVNVEGTRGKGRVNLYISNVNTSSQTSVEGLEEVNIDVQDIHILLKSSRADTMGTATFDGKGEWIGIPVTPRRVDLLGLSGIDTDSFVAEAELDEGFYSRIKLIVGNDNNVVINGETYPMKVTSGQQAVYIVQLGEYLRSGEEIDITIEFNAEKSVHVTGNNSYIFKPVWHTLKGKPKGDF